MGRTEEVTPGATTDRTHPLLVGIAGGSGSGKTTFVTELMAHLGPIDAVCLQHDFYYRDLVHLSEDERSKTNFDDPSALESELLVSHLEQLRERRPVEIPLYNFETHTRDRETRFVEPAQLIVVEGVLLFSHRPLLRLFDLTVFIETDADIRLARRIERDMRERGRSVESILSQYFASVRPMHRRYVQPSKTEADLCVSWNELDTTQVHKVANKILSRYPTALRPKSQA